MTHAYNAYDLESNGTTYRIEYQHDECMGEPWAESDGHGIVSDWVKRDKKPGEIVLCSDRGSYRYYDFQESIKIAKRDKWGVKNSDGFTNGQIINLAVMADFKHLKEWCNDEWHYCTICIFPLNMYGDELRSKSQYVGGIESNSDEYLKHCAIELIAEIE